MKLDLNTEQLEFLQFIIDNFEYNDDEHLIDKISDTFEYCIKSISFEPNRPHALTSYM